MPLREAEPALAAPYCFELPATLMVTPRPHSSLSQTIVQVLNY